MSASKTTTSSESTSQTTLLLPTISWSTNAGPLTTPVSLPPNCLDELWDLNTKGLMPGEIYTYFTQGCAISSCCPSSTPYSRAYEWLSTYYSPAICPQSYRACASPPSFTVEVDEEVAFCCPVKYACPGDKIDNLGWWACNSIMQSTTSAIIVNNPTDQSVIGTMPVSSSDYLNVAYPIQIRWKSADTTLFHTASETYSPIITPPPPSITPSATPTSSPNSKAPLSPALIAVIVLATVIITLIFIGCIWYIRRKERTTAEGAAGLGAQDQDRSHVQPNVAAAQLGFENYIQPHDQPGFQQGFQPGPQHYEKPAELPVTATLSEMGY